MKKFLKNIGNAFNAPSGNLESSEESEQSKEHILKVEEFLHNKEVAAEIRRTKEKLQNLKILVEQGIETLDSIAQEMQEFKELSSTDVEELKAIEESIAEVIDEIDGSGAYEEYVPANMRITAEEYGHALTDPSKRATAANKVAKALDHIALHMGGGGMHGGGIFGGNFFGMDKKLISVQEAHIDMKDGLEDAKQKFNNTSSQKNEPSLALAA